MPFIATAIDAVFSRPNATERGEVDQKMNQTTEVHIRRVSVRLVVEIILQGTCLR